jgi:poly(3-hydroxybutyrate) depolymerase/peptidoglycan/LPS O-acetylase OafA/YrhL
MSAVAPAASSAGLSLAPPAGSGGRGQRRPRVVALDLIRLLIIGFVVGVHVLSNGGGTVTPTLGAFITVFHTSRELFFLLTAFVLTYNYGWRPRVRWLPFWRRRYLLVIPAYVAWSLIYFLADGSRLDPLSAATSAFGHDLLTGNARYHMYFLLVTMQVYLAFPVVRWLLRRTQGHHRALFVAACAYQLALTLALRHHLGAPGPIGAWLRSPSPWLQSYVLYVIGGGLAAWHFEHLAAFTRRHTRAAMIVMAAGVCAGVGTYCGEHLILGEAPSAASGVFQPVVIVETFAYAWGLLAVGLRWADAGARHRRLISAGADCSFGIYLAHPLVLQGLMMLAGHFGVLSAIRHAPAAAEVAALLGVGVPVVYGVSWVLSFLLRRSPLSLVLTGREMVRSAVPGTRWVLLGAALLCALIMGTGLWAAHHHGPPTRPVRIARTVQTTGKTSMVRSVYTMDVSGRTRQWVQLDPGSGLTGSEPIIVVLAGVNATVNQEITRDHLTGYVQAGKAELVYPVGYEESWNAGGCCGHAAKADVDDVTFLEALVAGVDQGHKHPIDLVGYSNGGRLAYRIACTVPDLVDQIAVVKAAPEPGCVVQRPVTLLQIASTDDTAVPYQPGDKGTESPAATVQVARVKAADGCSDHQEVTTRGSLTLTTWQACENATRLGFAVYYGGTHSFPQPEGATPSGAAVIWAFFTNSGLPRAA